MVKTKEGKASEKRWLYTATLEEAIETSYADEEDETQHVTTSMYMPLWLRKIFMDIYESYDRSMTITSSRIIRLGTTLLQKRFGKQLEELGRLWKQIRWLDNALIARLEDFEYTVNSMTDIKKKTITIPSWCNHYLNSIKDNLNTNKSAMIRLSMYLALEADKGDLVNSRNVGHITTEIDKFNKQITDSIAVLSKLAELREGQSEL